MDAERFDSLVRFLSHTGSRRRALAAASGVFSGVVGAASVDEAAAKKKCPPCKKRNKQGRCKKKKPNGTACPGGTCQGGRCCVAESPATTCARACATVRTNNCGQAVACVCASGQDCLGNGTCAGTCAFGGTDCPTGCTCPEFREVGGANRCVPTATIPCSEFPQTCTSTAQCPRGQYCQVTRCGAGSTFENRCVPLCPG